MKTVAVVGLGSIGVRHATNLADLGCHVIGYDTSPERHQMLDRIDGAVAVGKFDEALNAADAVVVATPADSHIEIALATLRRGRNVFIEKPLSTDLAGTEALEEAASHRVAQVGYNLRFLPALKKAAALIADDAIGSILTGQIEFGYDLRKWNPTRDYRSTYSATSARGGGILLDAIHELDLALWLAGPIESVVATAAHVSDLEIETEDVAAALLTTENGAIISVTLDYLSPTYHRGFRLVGTEGLLEWSWSSGQLTFVRGEARAEFNWKTDVDAAYRDEMAHFLACLDGDLEPTTGIGTAIASLELAMAIRESASTGERVYLGEQPDE